MPLALRSAVAITLVVVMAALLSPIEAQPGRAAFADACKRVELGADLAKVKRDLVRAGGEHDQVGAHTHAFVRAEPPLEQRCVVRVDDEELVFMVVYAEREIPAGASLRTR